MVDQKTVEELFDKICDRLRQYSQEKRASTQPYQLADLQSLVKDYEYSPSDNIIREALIEHVGSLPIVATTIYPYLDDPYIDLGEALTMLAIHDIGELVTGDKITFLKGDESKEQEEAIKLLDPMYHDLYNRIEHPRDNDKTAQFAKSIDKMTPDFLDFITPKDITLARYKHFMETDKPEDIIQMKIDHKMALMTWSPLIKQLFQYTLDQTLKKLS